MAAYGSNDAAEFAQDVFDAKVTYAFGKILAAQCSQIGQAQVEGGESSEEDVMPQLCDESGGEKDQRRKDDDDDEEDDDDEGDGDLSLSIYCSMRGPFELGCPPPIRTNGACIYVPGPGPPRPVPLPPRGWGARGGTGQGSGPGSFEEIRNQNSGPEGHHFDSKFPAPHT